MKLVFVYPPQEVCPMFFTERIYKQNSREGAVLPPLGIAYLASILEKRHIVKIIDANALGLTVGEVINQLKIIGPDILLFSLVTTNFRTNLGWIKAIKKHIDVPVIVGGPQATVYPAETLTFEEIDFCVVGEGWETLPELIDCLSNGNYKNVKGIALRENNKITITETRCTKLTINDVGFPARHLLPNKNYTTILSKKSPITAMMSSSGCPFNCIYCGHNHNVVFRDPLKVVDEMEECLTKYKIREILFYDEIFSLDRKRASLICQEIIRRRLDIRWSIRTRPDCVNEPLIKLFAKAGCIRINYGIESANPEILRMLKRDMTLSRMTDAVRWAKREKINVFGFFMIGFPGESKQSILKTISLATQLSLDYVQFAKLVPLPDTELYSMVKEKTGDDFWRDYVLGRVGLESFVQFALKLSAEDLDDCLKIAYRRFYFRPQYILRRLLSVKSFKELRGLVNSALALV